MVTLVFKNHIHTHTQKGKQKEKRQRENNLKEKKLKGITSDGGKTIHWKQET